MTNAQERRQSDCSLSKSKGSRHLEVLSIANYAAMDPLSSVKSRLQLEQQHQDDIAVTACAQKMEDAYSCMGDDDEDDCMSMDSDDQTVKQGHKNEKKKKKKRLQKSKRRSSHTLTVVTPPPPRNSLDSTFASDDTRSGTRKVQMAPSLSMIYNPLGAKPKVSASPTSALKSSASTPAMNKALLNDDQKRTSALRASDKPFNPPSASFPSKIEVVPPHLLNLAPPPMKRAVTIGATTNSACPPSPSFPLKREKEVFPGLPTGAMSLAPPPMRRAVTIDSSPRTPATTAVKLSPMDLPPPPLQRATSALKSSTRLATSNKLKGSKSGVNIVRRITSWRTSGNKDKAPDVTDFFPAVDASAAASPAAPLVSPPAPAAMSQQEKEEKKKLVLSKFSQLTTNPITIPTPAAAAPTGADAEKERRKQLLQNKWKNITSTTELIDTASTASNGTSVKSALQENALATRRESAAPKDQSEPFAFPQALSTPDHLASMARQSYSLTSNGGLKKNRSFLKKGTTEKSNSNSSGMTAPDTASNQGSEYGSTYSGDSCETGNMKRRKSFFKLKKSSKQQQNHQPLLQDDSNESQKQQPIKRKSSFFRPKTKSFLKRIVSKTEVGGKSNDTWNDNSRQFKDPAARPL